MMGRKRIYLRRLIRRLIKGTKIEIGIQQIHTGITLSYIGKAFEIR
jgi:hypothetical protein